MSEPLVRSKKEVKAISKQYLSRYAVPRLKAVSLTLISGLQQISRIQAASAGHLVKFAE